jgi:hypothetical protein
MMLSYDKRMNTKLTSEDVERILKERLPYFQSKMNNGPYKKRASVLVPLFERDGEIYIWLTLRSSKLNSHAGEVSLPGTYINKKLLIFDRGQPRSYRQIHNRNSS